MDGSWKYFGLIEVLSKLMCDGKITVNDARTIMLEVEKMVEESVTK